MNRPRLATVWLDGCSGCHMSFLDLDERLVEIAERAELVYSPLIDVKEYPEGVDVCLVEGAVASEADLAKIRRSPGSDPDAGRVRRLRGHLERPRHAQPDRPPAAACPRLPGERHPERPDPVDQVVPRLLPHSAAGARASSTVDVFLPGCPPSADLIYEPPWTTCSPAGGRTCRTGPGSAGRRSG